MQENNLVQSLQWLCIIFWIPVESFGRIEYSVLFIGKSWKWYGSSHPLNNKPDSLVMMQQACVRRVMATPI